MGFPVQPPAKADDSYRSVYAGARRCVLARFSLGHWVSNLPYTTPPFDASSMLVSDPHESFVLRHRKAILFLTAALCVAGAYSAYVMPASVFPQTGFPRVVILIDNGVMPGDEMMATITRPVEEVKQQAALVAETIEKLHGVVDVNDGLIVAVRRCGSRCGPKPRRGWA